MDRSVITMDRINAGLEHFAEFGKEIVITEYDPPTVMRDRKDLYQFRLSPEEQAAWSVNFHTLAFSKPYISEICRWALSDRQGQKVDAGLLFADGRKKPEYHALKKLIQRDLVNPLAGRIGSARQRRLSEDSSAPTKHMCPAAIRSDSRCRHRARDKSFVSPKVSPNRLRPTYFKKRTTFLMSGPE